MFVIMVMAHWQGEMKIRTLPQTDGRIYGRYPRMSRVLSIIHRQPHRLFIGIGPLDPMPLVCRNVEITPRLKLQRDRLSIEEQPGASLQYDDPFVGILVVPEVRRG